MESKTKHVQLPPAEFFNARELQRLAVYKAAVVARFYTDQCEPPVRSSRAVAEMFNQRPTTVPTDDETIHGDMRAPTHQIGEDCGQGCID